MTDRYFLANDSGSVARAKRGSEAALTIKRSLDIAMGLALGALALPAMLIIATAIRLDSPGPALFRAKRIGRHGKPFSMYKFRTMIHGAEERLHEFAHLNVANGMVKIPDDPRVTRAGKWLRRFSLDELPQIYNIIAGHMSLVGPRPHDIHDIPHDGLVNEPRLGMRPGLTGLWQVSARSDPNLENRIRLDLLYVHQWSLLLDAKILAKTLPVVVSGAGGRVDGRNRIPNNNPSSLEIGSTGTNGSMRHEVQLLRSEVITLASLPLSDLGDGS
jgi:lipopolysaccharide/colanic/teichoic acid biosynthesis glycosyltransferase